MLGAAPGMPTCPRPSCGRAMASLQIEPVRDGVLHRSLDGNSLGARVGNAPPPRADFSTGCKDRQNMAMGAAAAVVVVLLVLYFSLGGSSAEPERIVLTRG